MSQPAGATRKSELESSTEHVRPAYDLQQAEKPHRRRVEQIPSIELFLSVHRVHSMDGMVGRTILLRDTSSLRQCERDDWYNLCNLAQKSDATLSVRLTTQ